MCVCVCVCVCECIYVFMWLSLMGVTGNFVGDLAHDYLKTALPIT